MISLLSALSSWDITWLEGEVILNFDTWYQVVSALASSAILVILPVLAFHAYEARMARYGLADWQLKKLQKDQEAVLIGSIAVNSYQIRRLFLVNQQERLRLKLQDAPAANLSWIDGSLQKLQAEIDVLDQVGHANTFIFAALPKSSGTDSWFSTAELDSDCLKKARVIREIPTSDQVTFDDGSSNLICFDDGSTHYLDNQEYQCVEDMLEERRVRTFLRQFFKFPWNLKMRFPGVQPPEVFFDCILDAWMASLLLMGTSTRAANLNELREAQRARLEEYVLSLIQAEALFNQKEGNYHHQISALGHWLALWQEMGALSRMYPGISLHEMHFNIELHVRQAAIYQEELRHLWRRRQTRVICMSWAVSLRPLLVVFEGLA